MKRRLLKSIFFLMNTTSCQKKSVLPVQSLWSDSLRVVVVVVKVYRFQENDCILCNKKHQKMFLFLSLTLMAKCCVIGRHCSASWQSRYYPRPNMSQPIDIKSFSESTKDYFFIRRNLSWLIWCRHPVSHRPSSLYRYVLFVLLQQKLPVWSRNCHKCQHITELQI